MPLNRLDYTFTMPLERRAIWSGVVVLAATVLMLAACYQAPAPVERNPPTPEKEAAIPPKPAEKPQTQARAETTGKAVLLPRAKPVETRQASVAPADGMVRVRAGDTVYALSRRHHVGVRDIINANRLKPPYKLLIGQTIHLPVARFHTVRPGETLYGLSQHYGVDMSALVRANSIPAPYRLVVGQRLQLPGALSETVKSAAVAEKKAPPPVRRVKKGLPEKPPPRAGKYFLWPAEGRMLSSFGPKEGGLHNDGINFAVQPGAPLRATENGVVAYAGNELPGYGNLLLIRHAGGWMSAYAHNEKLLVTRGDQVKRGQIVSHAGSTGNVSSPQAHFELRRNGKPVNPVKYLAKL